MINVTIFKKSDGGFDGFKVTGHAGFAEEGKDVVCAAVSALVINTINSIEQLTNDKFLAESDENDGRIKLKFLSENSKETKLLMESLILGIKGVKEDYDKKYIHIFFKEV
jgi:uncharacterized protein YsxB (DUF464 family)